MLKPAVRCVVLIGAVATACTTASEGTPTGANELASGSSTQAAQGAQASPPRHAPSEAPKADEAPKPKADQRPKGRSTTMPYLLGTPAPYARALLKRVFKLVPAGPPSIEIVKLSDGSKAKLRTHLYACAGAQDCGYAGFRLLTTAKDNRVVGGIANFDMKAPPARNASDSAKLFRLLAGKKQLDKATAWLHAAYRENPIGQATFGHATISIAKGAPGQWTLTVRLP